MTTSLDTNLDLRWQVLLADPNDVPQLQSWINSNEKEFGDKGAQAALRRAADLPNGWLAKIWLTRLLLDEKDGLERSMVLYREALRLAPRKSAAVQEIAGHMGEAGYFQEAIEFLLPIYSPDNHGPWAGFNLFNLCEDARDYDSAQIVLNRMKTARWPDFPGSRELQKIVRIRQEKLHILRENRHGTNTNAN